VFTDFFKEKKHLILFLNLIIKNKSMKTQTRQDVELQPRERDSYGRYQENQNDQNPRIYPSEDMTAFRNEEDDYREDFDYYSEDDNYDRIPESYRRGYQTNLDEERRGYNPTDLNEYEYNRGYEDRSDRDENFRTRHREYPGRTVYYGRERIYGPVRERTFRDRIYRVPSDRRNVIGGTRSDFDRDREDYRSRNESFYPESGRRFGEREYDRDFETSSRRGSPYSDEETFVPSESEYRGRRTRRYSSGDNNR
jgi:hypothetical protein